jgi:hypothetical protein
MMERQSVRAKALFATSTPPWDESDQTAREIDKIVSP